MNAQALHSPRSFENRGEILSGYRKFINEGLVTLAVENGYREAKTGGPKTFEFDIHEYGGPDFTARYDASFLDRPPEASFYMFRRSGDRGIDAPLRLLISLDPNRINYLIVDTRTEQVFRWNEGSMEESASFEMQHLLKRSWNRQIAGASKRISRFEKIPL